CAENRSGQSDVVELSRAKVCGIRTIQERATNFGTDSCTRSAKPACAVPDGQRLAEGRERHKSQTVCHHAFDAGTAKSGCVDSALKGGDQAGESGSRRRTPERRPSDRPIRSCLAQRSGQPLPANQPGKTGTNSVRNGMEIRSEQSASA